MKPLKVALIYKSRSGVIERDRRAMGWWSYPVPEFEWEFFPARGLVETREYRAYDLIFHEDTASAGGYMRSKPSDPPIVYLNIDSTLSEQHHLERMTFAKQADLVLVDHAKLERFRTTDKPVRRFNYCVNDHIFKPLDKTLDVVFHCSSGESRGLPGGKERNDIRRFLGEYCRSAVFSLRTGAVGLEEYAANIGHSRVVVNWPRTVSNRPHRVFDAMACGAALLTGPIPTVDGDDLEWGVHYLDYSDMEGLGLILKALVDGLWKQYADAGNELAMKCHIWAIRAQELRQILREELGL